MQSVFSLYGLDTRAIPECFLGIRYHWMHLDGIMCVYSSRAGFLPGKASYSLNSRRYK